jgi:hypothetical protein
MIIGTAGPARRQAMSLIVFICFFVDLELSRLLSVFLLVVGGQWDLRFR